MWAHVAQKVFTNVLRSDQFACCKFAAVGLSTRVSLFCRRRPSVTHCTMLEAVCPAMSDASAAAAN